MKQKASKKMRDISRILRRNTLKVQTFLPVALLLFLCGFCALTHASYSSLCERVFNFFTEPFPTRPISDIKRVDTVPLQDIFNISLKNAPSKKIKELTPEQMTKLTTLQIRQIAPEQIKELTFEQIMAFTPKQIRAFTSKQSSALRSEQIKSLTPEQIRTIYSSRQMESLTPEQKQAFTLDQAWVIIDFLTQHRLIRAFFTEKKITNGYLLSVATLRPEQIKSLTPEQIQRIYSSSRQMESLTPEQKQAFTLNQAWVIIDFLTLTIEKQTSILAVMLKSS